MATSFKSKLIRFIIYTWGNLLHAIQGDAIQGDAIQVVDKIANKHDSKELLFKLWTKKLRYPINMRVECINGKNG